MNMQRTCCDVKNYLRNIITNVLCARMCSLVIVISGVMTPTRIIYQVKMIFFIFFNFFNHIVWIVHSILYLSAVLLFVVNHDDATNERVIITQWSSSRSVLRSPRNNRFSFYQNSLRSALNPACALRSKGALYEYEHFACFDPFAGNNVRISSFSQSARYPAPLYTERVYRSVIIEIKLKLKVTSKVNIFFA